MTGARYLALPLLLAAAGCARPDLAPGDSGIPVPQRWAETDTAPLSSDVGEYWKQLDDPLLTQFVEQALRNNFDLAQNAARLAQARAQLASSKAGFWPQLTGGAGTSKDIGDFAQKDLNFNFNLNASWEADLFGQISGDVAASRAELAAAGYSLADVQRAIVGRVALTTIQARATALQLAIARDTLKYQEDNLQIARWRVQAGLVSSLDVEQARTQRAQTAATIPLLESNLAASANAISTLIGEPPGRVLARLQGSDLMPKPPETTELGAPAEVLRRRPDVRSAEQTLIANSARVGVARAQLFPLLRLTGNLTNASVGIGKLFDIITGGVFATFSQLIFDGGRARAQVHGAQAAAQGSLAAWRQSILTALEEVESASVDLNSSRQRVVIQDEAIDAATNAAVLARSQYQAGLVDFRDLLTAENQLLVARNTHVSAEADRASAFVRLTQALGGGWSPASLPNPPTDRLEP
ncbi:MAG TPA: efflux transporter outer membrane subunit [Croceibacterium sp.]|nr:efflux transporter outer membrane subunit [Croceibacterium sp.]